MSQKAIDSFEAKHAHLSVEEKIRAGFSHPTKAIQKYAVHYLEILSPCPPDVLELGLTHENKDVRHIASLQEVQYSEDQIERGLTDPCEWIRADFARYTLFTPTASQVERGISDKDSDVRTCWAHRTDVVLNDEQKTRLLKDKSKAVALALIGNTTHRFSAQQVEDGLCSAHAQTRETFLRRADFNLTDKQIKRIFKESDVDVLEAYVARQDVRLTPEQIEWVFDLAIEGAKAVPTKIRQTFSNQLFRGEHVLIALAQQPHFLPTVEQEKRVLDLPNELWLLKRTFVEQGGRWNSARERLALMARVESVVQSLPSKPHVL